MRFSRTRLKKGGGAFGQVRLRSEIRPPRAALLIKQVHRKMDASQTDNSTNATSIYDSLGGAVSWLSLGTLYSLARASVFLAGATFLAGTVLLYTNQRKMIYPANFPPGSRAQVWTPDEFGMDDWDEVHLNTEDGETVRAYVIKGRLDSKKNNWWKDSGAANGSDASAGSDGLTQRRQAAESSRLPTDPSQWNPLTLVFFHANAGNLGHRLPIAHMFRERFGCNIVMLSYRGYGKSTGSPSEPGIKTDVSTLLSYIESHPVLSQTGLVLYGQSIGGAVALHTATLARRLRAVIVENTFTSLHKLVPEVMPILGTLRLGWMVKDIWASEAAILRIPSEVPICFLSGSKDELIRPHHMHELYRLSRQRTDVLERNWWFPLREGTHNDTCMQPGYFDHIALFWETMVWKTKEAPKATLEAMEVEEASEAAVEGGDGSVRKEKEL